MRRFRSCMRAYSMVTSCAIWEAAMYMYWTSGPPSCTAVHGQNLCVSESTCPPKPDARKYSLLPVNSYARTLRPRMYEERPRSRTLGDKTATPGQMIGSSIPYTSSMQCSRTDLTVHFLLLWFWVDEIIGVDSARTYHDRGSNGCVIARPTLLEASSVQTSGTVRNNSSAKLKYLRTVLVLWLLHVPGYFFLNRGKKLWHPFIKQKVPHF
jgi:hypothetical protein